MPIYEYVCLDCGLTSSFLTLGIGVSLEPKCQNCGGSYLRKLVSRVAILRSESRGLDNFDGSDSGPDLGGPMDEDGPGPEDDLSSTGDDDG
jgi:putative FmdB family regulatory protein